MAAVQGGALHSDAISLQMQDLHQQDEDDEEAAAALARAESGAASTWQLLREHLERTIADSERLSDQLKRAWERAYTAALRGAAAGVVIRGGIHLISRALPKRKGKRGLSIPEQLTDTARYTAFLSALGLVFVTVDEGIAIFLGKRRTARWRALVAGAIAGQTLLLTGAGHRHYSLATYVLLRGLTLLVRTGNKPGAGVHPIVRALLAPTRLQHGDTLLMCLASSQIIYSFIMMPSSLPTSYIRFINRQASKELYVWQAVKELALNNSAGRPQRPLKILHGTPWQQCTGPTPCEFWHPGHSCAAHPVSIAPGTYLRALGVYLPVYLLPALLVHRQKLLLQPGKILPKVALGVARSAAFLTSFIGLAFGGACVGFNLTGTVTGPVIAASTWPGGLATLLEKKSRRMELALYCASRAAESFSRCLVEWGVVASSAVPPRLDVLLFSAGCAAIMHCYSDARGKHRDVFKSKYLNVLDFVFGNSGVSEGAIKHLPSNRDILASGLRTLRSFSSTQRLLSLDTAAGPGRAASAPHPGQSHHHHTRSLSALSDGLGNGRGGRGGRAGGRLSPVDGGSSGHGHGLLGAGGVHRGVVSMPAFSLLMPPLSPGESEGMGDVPEEDEEGEDEHGGHHVHGRQNYAAAALAVAVSAGTVAGMPLGFAPTATHQHVPSHHAAHHVAAVGELLSGPSPTASSSTTSQHHSSSHMQPLAPPDRSANLHHSSDALQQDSPEDVRPMLHRPPTNVSPVQYGLRSSSGSNGIGIGAGFAGVMHPSGLSNLLRSVHAAEDVQHGGGSSSAGHSSAGQGAFGSAHPSGDALDDLPGGPTKPVASLALPSLPATAMATSHQVRARLESAHASDNALMQEVSDSLGDLDAMEHAVRGGRVRGSSTRVSETGTSAMRRIYTDPGCLATLYAGHMDAAMAAGGGDGEERVHGGGSGTLGMSSRHGSSAALPTHLSAGHAHDHMVHGAHGSLDHLMMAMAQQAGHGSHSGRRAGVNGEAGVTTFTAASTHTESVTAWRSARAHVLPGISITRSRRSTTGSSGRLEAPSGSAPAFGGIMLEVAAEAEQAMRAYNTRHGRGPSNSGGGALPRVSSVGASLASHSAPQAVDRAAARPSISSTTAVPIPGTRGRRGTAESGSRPPSRLQSVTSASSIEQFLVGSRSSEGGRVGGGSEGSCPPSCSLPSSLKISGVVPENVPTSSDTVSGAQAQDVGVASGTTPQYVGSSPQAGQQPLPPTSPAAHVHEWQGSKEEAMQLPSPMSSPTLSSSRHAAPSAAATPQPVSAAMTSASNAPAFMSSIRGRQSSPMQFASMPAPPSFINVVHADPHGGVAHSRLPARPLSYAQAITTSGTAKDSSSTGSASSNGGGANVASATSSAAGVPVKLATSPPGGSGRPPLSPKNRGTPRSLSNALAASGQPQGSTVHGAPQAAGTELYGMGPAASQLSAAAVPSAPGSMGVGASGGEASESGATAGADSLAHGVQAVHPASLVNASLAAAMLASGAGEAGGSGLHGAGAGSGGSSSSIDSLSAFASESTALTLPNMSDLSFHDWEGHLALQQALRAGSPLGARVTGARGGGSGGVVGQLVERRSSGEFLFDFGGAGKPPHGAAR